MKTNLFAHRAARCAAAFALLLVLCRVCAAGTPEHRAGTLLPGSPFSTDWYLVESGEPGPTVIVTGGVHGNEPAGALAAGQIRHWPIDTGRLIVVPPHRNERSLRDLNRNFPTESNPEPRTELASAVWAFVSSHEPDWVIDLHEGFDFHSSNSDSVGSSVIAFPDQAALAAELVTLADSIADEDHPFSVLASKGPIAGSLARAAAERLGAEALILETTFKDQPPSLRARQHRLMVAEILRRAGMIEGDRVDVLAPADGDGLTVGVFDDSGASEDGTLRALRRGEAISATPIGRHDLSPASLAQFDVLVFPGGSGSRQARAMGEAGREHVRRFVEDGGGYVGICAGAYLCSAHYDWSLNLMNTAVFNTMVDIPGVGRKSMWYRGPPADVEVELHSEAAPVLGLTGTHIVRYQNGPILSEGDHPDAPAYEVLATFQTENGIYDAQKGTMVGTPAVVRSVYGAGRVLAISPHFESTAGLENAVVNAVRSVAGD